MPACMYVYMYVRNIVCVAFMIACLPVCMYACMYARMPVGMPVCVYDCASVQSLPVSFRQRAWLTPLPFAYLSACPACRYVCIIMYVCVRVCLRVVCVYAWP